jgi:heme oxygenase
LLGTLAVEALPSLLLRLNVATAAHHAALDAPWLELQQPTVTAGEYLHHLVRTYGLIAPFEGACRYTRGLDAYVDPSRLGRAGLIAQDLLALGLTPAQVASIEQCPAISTYRSPSEAIGWLYVLERSRPLHQGIKHALVCHVTGVGGAMTYLSSDSGHVGHHWATLGRIVEHAGATPEAAEDLVSAAREASEVCLQWYRHPKYDSPAHPRGTDGRRSHSE